MGTEYKIQLTLTKETFCFYKIKNAAQVMILKFNACVVDRNEAEAGAIPQTLCLVCKTFFL